MMTPIDILLIRACKSLNPYQRVLSVYRRFYNIGDIEIVLNSSGDIPYCGNITNLLADIVDKYIPIKIKQVIYNLQPKNFYTKEHVPYEKRVFGFLVSVIRMSEINPLLEMGFRKAAKFRN